MSFQPPSTWEQSFLSVHNSLKKKGFPDSSAGKESACNVGDPSSIPGSGTSPGEGKGYSLQCSGLEDSKE